jgi:hypothetical protein
VQGVASSRAGHWLEGKCLAADVAWEKAAEYAGEVGDDRERAYILAWLASSAFTGPTPVDEAIRRCEAIREQVNEDRGSAAATLYPLAGLYAMLGRFDEARELLDLASRRLEDLGFVTLTSSGTQFEGLVGILAGDLTRGGAPEVRFGTARGDGREGICLLISGALGGGSLPAGASRRGEDVRRP